MTAAAPAYISPLATVFLARDDGHAALLLDGRSLYDLDADREGKLRPLHELLRRECRERGLLLVSYSMAGGLEWDSPELDDRERRSVHELLRGHRLSDLPQDQNEVARVIRGVASLSRVANTRIQWSTGAKLQFCILFEFADHLVPGSLANGTQTESQLVAIQLATITAQSLALRASGNLILFHGRDGLLDDLVRRALHRVRLHQPTSDEKRRFLAAAMPLYPKAVFKNLDAAAVSHLTSNTPNRGLEDLLRASHRSGRVIEASHLGAQKSRDVEEVSEGTLAVLDTTRVEGVKLHGATVEAPLRVLRACAAALLRGDRTMPANLLLAGPPGSGKTDLAIIAARNAGVAAYSQLNPKDSLVGSTERRARLQQETLEEWTPNISVVDEVTESLPLERSSHDGDSGASRAVTAALLTSLSNENRRGRSLLIATTNCPWRMGAAMRSRFEVVPVLHPVAPDYPGIVLTTARRIVPELLIDPTDSSIEEAARLFFAKCANARHIRSALSGAMLEHGELTPDLIVLAARDLRAGADHASAIYADLCAIELTTRLSFLPWNSNPATFPYPPHLQGVVNLTTGEVNQAELEKRISEFRPQANV